MYGKQVEANMCLGQEGLLMTHPADAAQESVVLPLPLRITDVNGNGAADVVYFKNTTTTTSGEVKALLGSGYAMDGPTVTLGLMSEFDNLSAITFANLAAGRGSDMVYLKAGTRQIVVRPWSNVTQSFGSPAVVASAPTGESIQSLMTGDFNGDGRQDVVAVIPYAGLTTPLIYLNQSTEARLTEIRNGLLGYRRITYVNAAAMANTFDVPPQMVVRTVVDSPYSGLEFGTTFEYDKGVYDPLEKRFLGFWKTMRTQSCVGGTCPRTTVYSDIDYTGARPARIDRTDTSGKLFHSTTLRYAPKTTLPYSNPLTEKWTFRYASNSGTSRREAFAYTYDQYGRTTTTTEYGGGATPLRMTVNEYTTMSASYLSKLARTALYEGGAVSEAQKRSESRYTYDSNGLMASSQVWVSPTPAGTTNPYVTTSYGYDSQYRLIQKTAPLGRITKYAYETDLGLNVESVTNPANQVEIVNWNPTCGKPRASTGVNADVTTFTYDAFCRETAKTHASGGFERTSYFPAQVALGQRVRVERPSPDGTGNFFVDTYFDGDNRPIEIRTKGPRTIVVRKSYDGHGHLASETQPFYDGDPVYSTNYKYDVLGRKTQTIYASGKSVSTVYGASATCTNDEEGHVSCDDLDSIGNRYARREQSGTQWITTTFQYTTAGEVRQIRDALGNLTTYTIDSLGRKVGEVDPVTGTTTTVYNAAGGIDRQTNGLGETTVYGYDSLGRLRSRTTRSGTANAKTVTFDFDQYQAGFANTGRMTRMTDALGTTSFSYDLAGNIARKVRSFVSDGDAPPASQTFSYTYDAGRRVIRVTAPDNTVAHYMYDAAGRPVGLNLALTSPTNFQSLGAVEYDAAGQPTRADYANSSYTQFTYEPTRHFLTAMKTTAAFPMTNEVLAYTYVRDGEGRITRINETTDSWSDQTTYAYDARHQLTSAVSTLRGTQTWSYDEIGRMIASPFGTNCYAAGPTAPHAVRSVGTCGGAHTYVYNAIGSLLGGPVVPSDPNAGRRTLSYDGDGRLEQVSMVLQGTPNPYVEKYKYDANGARLRSITSATPGVVASTTYFLGDDFEITRKPSGDTITQHYSLGQLPIAKRTRVAAVNTLTVPYTDHLGSIVAEGNAAGTLVSPATDYHSFGEERSGKIGASATRHRAYLAEMQDATGLLYLNARYYDPVSARFVSADPLRAIETTVGLHPYAYGQNDPINRSDRTGEMSEREGGNSEDGSSVGTGTERGLSHTLGVIFDKVGQVLDAIDRRFTINYPDPGDPEGTISANILDSFGWGGMTVGRNTAKRVFVAGRTEVLFDALNDLQKADKETKFMSWVTGGYDHLVPLGTGAGGWGEMYAAIVHHSDELVFDLRGMKYQPIRHANQWWQPTARVGNIEIPGTLTNSELQWLYTTAGQQELNKTFFRNIPSNFPVPMITPAKWRAMEKTTTSP